MFGDEPLSLGTFEPAYAQPPYINTPRSLEACRRHGINPVELVEVSIDEFRKEYPDDPDAAQRRYDRVDGARRRMLTTVLTEWKNLSDTKWMPQSMRTAPAGDRESILHVSAAAHSSMLESQAAKFRKIEMDQWSALQRMLAMSVKSASIEQKNKEILKKQNVIGEKNSNAKRDLQAKREALYQEHAEMKKRKEFEYQQEVKRLQAMEAEEAVQHKARTVERLREEKERREKREATRIQQSEYTKQLKAQIMKDLDAKADARKRLADMQERESQDRVREMKEQKEAEKDARRKELADKQARARQGVLMSAEEQRKAMLDQIQADEDRRKRIKDSLENERGSGNQAANAAMLEKMQRIRDCNADADREKSEKALADLNFKEALAKQELDKVKAAQDKRKSNKAIRQEAYDLASSRKKKADDYRKRLAEKAIQDKDNKCLAIKNGFQTLTQMRMKMRDIMHSATLQIKDEIHRLKHRDEFSPDRVITGALDVSERALFPKLKSAFGMANYVNDEQQKAIDATVGYDEPKSNARATTAPSNLVSQSMPNLRNATTSHGKSKKATDDASHVSVAGGFTRGELPKTLPIKVLNPGRLQEALIETKAKIERKDSEAIAAEETKRLKSPPRGKKIGQVGNKGGSYDDDEFEDDEDGAPATQSSAKPNKKKSSPDSSPAAAAAGKYNNTQSNFDVDDERVFKNFPYDANKSPGAATGRQGQQSDKSAFLPTKPGEFRREYSGDHPLQGGMGLYKKETASGNKAAGTGGAKPLAVPVSSLTPTQASAKVERLTLAAQVKVVDPQRQLEQLRREQNEALMRVLEEEKSAEEARERMGRAVMSETEASRLEMVFAEERRRASERIVRLTKEHESRIKEAVLAQMALSGGKGKQGPKAIAGVYSQ